MVRSVDTEDCLPAQHLHVYVLDIKKSPRSHLFFLMEVEGFIPSYSHGVDGRFVVSGVDGRKARQGGNADGSGVTDSNGGCGGLRFEISKRKSEGYQQKV